MPARYGSTALNFSTDVLTDPTDPFGSPSRDADRYDGRPNMRL
jgi:hypothetical protein